MPAKLSDASPIKTGAASPGVQHGIQSIRIDRTTVCFEGTMFGGAGTYERLEGSVRGQLDPLDPRNTEVVNLDRAPRNAQGLVDYTVDLCILKPVDLSRGNGWLFYEVLNRGGKRALCRINTAPAKNVPDVAADAGNGFLMKEGFTLVWTGWQSDVTRDNGRMIADFPVPTIDGQPIVGQSQEEFIDLGDGDTFIGTLTYPAADLSPAKATLTVRERERDPRQRPAGLAWRYLNDRTVEITRPQGADFDKGAIYEFIYPAKDPKITGIAFASVRDIVSFLRHETHAADGSTNPLLVNGRPAMKRAMNFGLSQSGRFVRDFLYRGFNEDHKHQMVFDAAVPVIAGSRRTMVNYPFAQPGRYSRQHENHNYPDDQFPFTYRNLHDPISGKTAGILDRCLATGTCPKIMHLDTDAEIWSARASLVVTDCDGNDIEQPENVRVYLACGIEHGNPEAIPDGIIQHPHNPLFYGPLLRPLIRAMVDWVDKGVPPPPSRFPSRQSGTLVPVSELSFDRVPGLKFEGCINELRLMDYSVLPPREGAKAYPIFAVKVDDDGNPVDGVRHPLVLAPIATHLGWNLRAKGHAEGELYSIVGAIVPFALTEAERARTNDARASVETRYGDRDGWVHALSAVCAELVSSRYLLQEDADTLLAAAKSSWDVFEVI
ncbi:alpha/beta hydrolase domain-containing protein [Bradyrhizobium sp. LHD-71]|uniref:alpha/beta hydrolase domain-containing protein n=1 Tax=Bradyrhizobium sp. LHD-71 TaxID=3072141 RepID=UPI00280E87D7|nr:alpha/beta hydrolase domain-containing protein [Bradyrhizobium sp. LHD-71]MDQ8728004.1 alpha/beta hydrolase domain-containing protein [Bradyrhizobium sp. LHD-71]